MCGGDTGWDKQTDRQTDRHTTTVRKARRLAVQLEDGLTEGALLARSNLNPQSLFLTDTHRERERDAHRGGGRERFIRLEHRIAHSTHSHHDTVRVSVCLSVRSFVGL